jgi:hypothetical protein
VIRCGRQSRKLGKFQMSQVGRIAPPLTENFGFCTVPYQSSRPTQAPASQGAGTRNSRPSTVRTSHGKQHRGLGHQGLDARRTSADHGASESGLVSVLAGIAIG